MTLFYIIYLKIIQNTPSYLGCVVRIRPDNRSNIPFI